MCAALVRRNDSDAWALLRDHASGAVRLARDAGPSSVPDEQLVRPAPFLSGSSWRVSPSRRATRPTCVSTGSAGVPKAWFTTTPAVFHPTPGRRYSSSRVRGSLPPYSRAIRCMAARTFRALPRYRPMRRIMRSNWGVLARA